MLAQQPQRYRASCVLAFSSQNHTLKLINDSSLEILLQKTHTAWVSPSTSGRLPGSWRSGWRFRISWLLGCRGYGGGRWAHVEACLSESRGSGVKVPSSLAAEHEWIRGHVHEYSIRSYLFSFNFLSHFFPSLALFPPLVV